MDHFHLFLQMPWGQHITCFFPQGTYSFQSSLVQSPLKMWQVRNAPYLWRPSAPSTPARTASFTALLLGCLGLLCLVLELAVSLLPQPGSAGVPGSVPLLSSSFTVYSVSLRGWELHLALSRTLHLRLVWLRTRPWSVRYRCLFYFSSTVLSREHPGSQEPCSSFVDLEMHSVGFSNYYCICGKQKNPDYSFILITSGLRSTIKFW